jgi:hypothetical protein
VKNTTDRGYGYRHQQERKRWAPRVEAGLEFCRRCHLPILAGQAWDLDHSDLDRTRYLGPSHRRCNRATAGRPGRRKVRRWPRRSQSRQW